MNEQAVKYFSFTQFRFAVAAVLLLAAGLKTWQLATTPLPPVVQGSVLSPLLELFNNRYLLMAVVVGEILFALVLIAEFWKQWSWLLSLLAFAAFTLVSLTKGISGESSCGCFGTVTVNPWITTCFDLIIMILLLVFRERSDWTFTPLDKKRVSAVLIIWLALAVPVLCVMLSPEEQPHETLGVEFTGPDGKKMILLEPKTWIDKEFPLFSRFVEPRGSEVLRQGTWDVLLIHTDCPKCRQIMADLESQHAENVAVVVIPSQQKAKMPNTSFPTFWLDRQNNWFVSTPFAVEISDGICVRIWREDEE